MLPSAAWWAVAVVGGPLLLAWLNGRQQRRATKAQWERDDRVAARAVIVAERAEVVAQRAESAVESAQETQHAIVAQGAINADKLDEIHMLVNSNLTAAVRGELDANIERLATLREIVDLKRGVNLLPSAETLEAIAVVEARIGTLRTALADRVRQQEVAERRPVQQDP